MSRPLFDDDQNAYRESFRAFVARDTDGDAKEVFAKAAEHGFASMAVPEDRGGADITDRRFGVVVAEELGLAPNTVAKAYRELEHLGVIETRGRAGSFVSGDRVGRAAREAAQEYADRVTALGVAPAEAVNLVRRALEG